MKIKSVTLRFVWVRNRVQLSVPEARHKDSNSNFVLRLQPTTLKEAPKNKFLRLPRLIDRRQRMMDSSTANKYDGKPSNSLVQRC